jgi:hypothetical protein
VIQRYDLSSISREDRDFPTCYSPLPHIEKCEYGDYVLYDDHLEEMDHTLKDAAGRVAELTAEVDRLKVDSDRSLSIAATLDRENQKLTSEAKAHEKAFNIEWEEAERLTAEVARLREIVKEAIEGDIARQHGAPVSVVDILSEALKEA